MLTSITHSGIYVLDQDEALDFYVGTLGLEVNADADLGFMRWLTVNVPGEPDREIVLVTPGPPAMDEATAEEARELVAKGASAGWLIFSTADCRKTYEELLAKGVEFTQEPVEHFYGIDCALRDPFGNSIRITQPAPRPLDVPAPATRTTGAKDASG
jgi:catechol 2,3-dioxygenase-like lactoylglutathione lyase family enzyme